MSLEEKITEIVTRISNEFNTLRQELPSLQQGSVFFDIPNDYMYVIFGVDGNWEVTRFRDVEEITGPQIGSIPTDLEMIVGLDYT